MVDDHVRLLVAQESLEQDAPAASSSSPAAVKTFVGLSLSETLRQCLLAGMDKRVDKLRAEFKVPDKRCAATSTFLALSVSLCEPN